MWFPKIHMTVGWDTASVTKVAPHLHKLIETATFTPLQKFQLSLLSLIAISSFNPQWLSLFQTIKWQSSHIRCLTDAQEKILKDCGTPLVYECHFWIRHSSMWRVKTLSMKRHESEYNLKKITYLKCCIESWKLMTQRGHHNYLCLVSAPLHFIIKINCIQLRQNMFVSYGIKPV